MDNPPARDDASLPAYSDPPPVDQPLYVQPTLSQSRDVSGRHGSFLLTLDQSMQLLDDAFRDADLEGRFADLAVLRTRLDQLFEVLQVLSADRTATYRNRDNIDIPVPDFEAWLKLFASALLDPISRRCSELLLAALDGDAVAGQVGDALRDFLQYQLPQALRSEGYEPVPAFPLSGSLVDTACMRVVGRVDRPQFSQQVVGVVQYGIIHKGALLREAQVTVA